MNSSQFNRLCTRFARYLVNPSESPDSEIWGHLDDCKSCQNRLLTFDGKENPGAFDEHFKSELALAREVLLTDLAGKDRKTGGEEASDPDPSALEVPEIPGFELAEIIGRGSTGVVWKAVQQDLNRVVALKIIQNDSASFQERLKKEAKILASLQHPHLLTIYSFGSWNGKLWMALEFCPGGSLYRQSGQPWNPHLAANVVRQVALGAQAAHEKGIIHRDIKPGNILLGLDGLPRLADFDLARNPKVSQEPAVAGQVQGTPAYISPEQAQAKEIDCRADVHGIGAVLYYLLTGRPPFRADSPPEVLFLAVHANPIATNKIRPEVPADLDRICMKCLTKDPLDRYQTAAELADDLDRFLANKPVRARPLSPLGTSWRWAKRNKALAITGLFGLAALVMVVTTSTVLAFMAAALTKAQDSNSNPIASTLPKDKVHTPNEPNRPPVTAVDHVNRALGTQYRAQINLARSAWENADPKIAQDHLDRCAFGRRQWEHHFLHTLFHGNQFDLEGHTDAVLAVCLSRDGSLIASGGKDRTVIVREVETGRILHNYARHAGTVNAVAFGINSNLVASGGDDTTVHLWDPITGYHFATLETDRTPVLGVVFHPDGERIYATTTKGNCFVWKMQTGSLIKTFKVDDLPVRALAINKDGTRLAMGSDGRALSLYDTRSLDLIATGRGSCPILSLDFSPDGQRIVSGNDDEKDSISIWNAKTAALRETFRGHKKSVSKAQFTPDGTRIVSVSHDMRILIWDALTGMVQGEIKGHAGSISGASLHGNGNLLVTSGLDRLVKIWNLDHPYFPVYNANGPEQQINCFKESKAKGPLIAGTQKGVILFLDQRKLTPQRSIAAHTGPVSSLDIASDGDMVATGSSDHTGKIWNLPAGKLVSTLTGHKGPISAILFDRSGKRAITSSWDSTIRIWDTLTGEAIAQFEQHQSKINTMVLDFSPGTTQVVSGDDSGKVMVWDLESRVVAKELDFGNSIRAMALSHGRATLVVASENNQLFLVKMKQQFQQSQLAGHITKINHISFSSDDKRFVTADGDSKIRVWDAETNEVVLALNGHAASVTQATFAADEQALFSCGTDRTMRAFSAQMKDPWMLIPHSARSNRGDSTSRREAQPQGPISFGFPADSSQLVQVDPYGHRLSTEIATGIQQKEADLAVEHWVPSGGQSPDKRLTVRGDANGAWLGDLELLDLFNSQNQKDLVLWTHGPRKPTPKPLTPADLLPGQHIGRGAIPATGQSSRNTHAFAALKKDGSVVAWGDPTRGGDSSSVANQLQGNVIHLYSNSEAFAALKNDGSVVAWGAAASGGDSSPVADQLRSGVTHIYSTSNAFAALKSDGSVITWGNTARGGNSSQVKDHLRSGVVEIFSNFHAFAAKKSNGGLVTWGDSRYGGDCLRVANRLTSDVVSVFGTGFAFAAVKRDGSVVAWGSPDSGGDISEIDHYLRSGVVKIVSAATTLAALKEDGSVVSWSDADGKHWPVGRELSSGVVDLFASSYCFAAIKRDGSVVTWGHWGRIAPKNKTDPELQSGAVTISTNHGAFAALESNGRVATWGYSSHGADTTSVDSQLKSGVVSIFANSQAFAALKNDGSVVTWGRPESGGDSRAVAKNLTSKIRGIYATQEAFAALSEEGSVVTWGDPLLGGDSARVAKHLASGVVAFASPSAQSPWFVSSSHAQLEAGKSCEHRIQARGLPMSMTYRIVSGRLPEGIVLDPSSGCLSGTPTANSRGDNAIQVEATNGVTRPTALAMVLTVR